MSVMDLIFRTRMDTSQTQGAFNAISRGQDQIITKTRRLNRETNQYNRTLNRTNIITRGMGSVRGLGAAAGGMLGMAGMIPGLGAIASVAGITQMFRGYTQDLAQLQTQVVEYGSNLKDLLGSATRLEHIDVFRDLVQNLAADHRLTVDISTGFIMDIKPFFEGREYDSMDAFEKDLMKSLEHMAAAHVIGVDPESISRLERMALSMNQEAGKFLDMVVTASKHSTEGGRFFELIPYIDDLENLQEHLKSIIVLQENVFDTRRIRQYVRELGDINRDGSLSLMLGLDPDAELGTVLEYIRQREVESGSDLIQALMSRDALSEQQAEILRHLVDNTDRFVELGHLFETYQTTVFDELKGLQELPEMKAHLRELERLARESALQFTAPGMIEQAEELDLKRSEVGGELLDAPYFFRKIMGVDNKGMAGEVQTVLYDWFKNKMFDGDYEWSVQNTLKDAIKFNVTKPTFDALESITPDIIYDTFFKDLRNELLYGKFHTDQIKDEIARVDAMNMLFQESGSEMIITHIPGTDIEIPPLTPERVRAAGINKEKLLEDIDYTPTVGHEESMRIRRPEPQPVGGPTSLAVPLLSQGLKTGLESHQGSWGTGLSKYVSPYEILSPNAYAENMRRVSDYRQSVYNMHRYGLRDIIRARSDAAYVFANPNTPNSVRGEFGQSAMRRADTSSLAQHLSHSTGRVPPMSQYWLSRIFGSTAGNLAVGEMLFPQVMGDSSLENVALDNFLEKPPSGTLKVTDEDTSNKLGQLINIMKEVSQTMINNSNNRQPINLTGNL